MPSVAETLHWLRDQRDRLKMEAEEKRSLKVLGHELDKLRQEIRDLGGEPCCLLEDYPVAREPKKVEVTPEMIEAGAKAAARVLDESSSSFCELVAREVFRAMIAAQDK